MSRFVPDRRSQKITTVPSLRLPTSTAHHCLQVPFMMTGDNGVAFVVESGAFIACPQRCDYEHDVAPALFRAREKT